MEEPKPLWYIQVHNDHDEAAQRLIKTVQDLGFEVATDRYIPFNDDHDLSKLPSHRPVVFQGAISVVKVFQQHRDRWQLNLSPFAWFDFDQFTCHSYYSRWGQWLINKNYILMPLGDLPRNRDRIYSMFDSDVVFIRPDSNDKLFTGQVVEKGDFDRWMNWAYTEGEVPDAVVVVAEARNLEAEWRLVMSGSLSEYKYEVIAGSRYRAGDKLDVERGYPEEAAVVAIEACKKWAPHELFVLDIGKTADGYGIVECGSINCAGLYDCDLVPVVKAMSEQAAADWETHTWCEMGAQSLAEFYKEEDRLAAETE
jgi:hypothetical protein